MCLPERVRTVKVEHRHPLVADSSTLHPVSVAENSQTTPENTRTQNTTSGKCTCTVALTERVDQVDQ